MDEAKKDEMQFPECPFAAETFAAALSEFLANPGWKRIYDDAPTGAKRRLEVSFWFSKNKPTKNVDSDYEARFQAYRDWRADVERVMSEEDIIYMFKVMDKPAAKEHYAALLKCRREHKHVNTSGIALMSCGDFFAMLEDQGEFKSFDYDDATKASIIGDFYPVLSGSGDPLETHVEDILATATLKEVRVYPKDEIMYVRVEVRFLTETAEWSDPYQMLAAWDCFHELMGYVFPIGKGRRSEIPIEMENPENELQHEKRIALRSMRISAMGKNN